LPAKRAATDGIGTGSSSKHSPPIAFPMLGGSTSHRANRKRPAEDDPSAAKRFGMTSFAGIAFGERPEASGERAETPAVPCGWLSSAFSEGEENVPHPEERSSFFRLSTEASATPFPPGETPHSCTTEEGGDSVVEFETSLPDWLVEALGRPSVQPSATTAERGSDRRRKRERTSDVAEASSLLSPAVVESLVQENAKAKLQSRQLQHALLSAAKMITTLRKVADTHKESLASAKRELSDARREVGVLRAERMTLQRVIAGLSSSAVVSAMENLSLTRQGRPDDDSDDEDCVQPDRSSTRSEAPGMNGGHEFVPRYGTSR
jgi:hypothetical protein